MQTFRHFHNKECLYPTCKIHHFFCTYGVIRCKSIGSKDIGRLMSFLLVLLLVVAPRHRLLDPFVQTILPIKRRQFRRQLMTRLFHSFLRQGALQHTLKSQIFASTFWYSIFVSPSFTPLKLHNRGSALIICIQKAFCDQPCGISDHLLPKFIITLKLPCET